MTENKEPAIVEPEQLSFSTKTFYSFGALGDYLMTGMIGTLAINIYHIGIGVSPVLIGWALAIPRLWDAFTDPVIANISDNAHTRYGRRRPFMLTGVVLTAIFCVLVWRPPLSMSEYGMFGYFLIFSFLYFTAFTVFSIPYHALGAELTSDYDERTRLMSFKSIFAGLGGVFFLPWAYKLCFVFGSNEVEGVKPEVIGVRAVGIIYAFLMVAFVIIPVFFCRERFADVNRQKISTIHAIKCTIKNKPFLILCITVVTAMIGVYLVAPLGMIINMTYVFAGSEEAKESSATIGGFYGTVYSICAVVSVPIIRYLSTRFGKKHILQAGLLLSATGFLLSWFIINPKMPYLQLLLAIIVAPGLGALTLLVYALIADVCDLDELNTGLRREGMYSGVYTWFVKISSTSVLAITGYLLVWTGFDPDNLISTPQTVLRLRLAMMLIPSGLMLLAAYIMTFYPLDRAKLNQIQAQLRENRENR
jgi:GPH family glycoside/pentoside/hexuronide:cation symporter